MTSEARPPRLVVDTNLLVGHLFRPQAGGLARVVDLWRRGEVRACVSAAVLREVRATLRRIPVDAGRRQELLDLLADPDRTELHEEVADSGFRCADPADDKFLHLAVGAPRGGGRGARLPRPHSQVGSMASRLRPMKEHTRLRQPPPER